MTDRLYAFIVVVLLKYLRYKLIVLTWLDRSFDMSRALEPLCMGLEQILEVRGDSID